MNSSTTPIELQQEIVEIIKQLFAHETLTDSAGWEKKISVHMQDLPYKEVYTEEDTDKPEPYIIVHLLDLSTPEPDSHPTIRFAIICCVCDEDTDRQGYRDSIHLMNKIYLRFVENGTVGGYALKYPVNWATQEDDSHPYYFTGVELSFESSGYFVKEAPFEW